VFGMSFFLQAPYSIPTEYKDKKPVEFVGFSVLILKELQNRMNFT
jgi:ABC-type amino acid transport substrate-binding protein